MKAYNKTNEQIEIDTYSSWHNLVNYVERIIREFGKEYKINFAQVLNAIVKLTF